MKRTILLLPILIIILAVSAYSQDEPLAVGTEAPDFTLPGLDGTEFTLSDFKGNVVILEWTNPNCPFVVRHYVDDIMPALQRKYTGKDVIWLVINSTHPEHRDFETEESLQEIFTEWNAAYTAQLMDITGNVGRKYRAVTTPHMYIIDAEGVLVYNGAIDDDPRGQKDIEERVNYLDNAMKELLEGKEITVTITRPYGCTVKYTKDT